jgi:hypothetical protein
MDGLVWGGVVSVARRRHAADQCRDILTRLCRHRMLPGSAT